VGVLDDIAASGFFGVSPDGAVDRMGHRDALLALWHEMKQTPKETDAVHAARSEEAEPHSVRSERNYVSVSPKRLFVAIV